MIVQSIINMFLIISTLMFSQLKHPLAMGFLLLIQVMIISMITGSMYESFWFSYILFLVFLGGMLVLFIYVASLASNEMFNFSMKILIMMCLIMFVMATISVISDNTHFSFIFNNEMINNQFNLNMKEITKSLSKLYNFPSSLMTIMLINYLFFTLIVAVKITNFFFGPIRNLT